MINPPFLSICHFYISKIKTQALHEAVTARNLHGYDDENRSFLTSNFI